MNFHVLCKFVDHSVNLYQNMSEYRYYNKNNITNYTYPLCHFVYFMIQEVIVCIKVQLPEHALADQLVGHLALDVHH